MVHSSAIYTALRLYIMMLNIYIDAKNAFWFSDHLKTTKTTSLWSRLKLNGNGSGPIDVVVVKDLNLNLNILIPQLQDEGSGVPHQWLETTQCVTHVQLCVTRDKDQRELTMCASCPQTTSPVPHPQSSASCQL